MVLDRLAKAREQAVVWAAAVGQVQVVAAGVAVGVLLWALVVIVFVQAVGRQLRISVAWLATNRSAPSVGNR